MFKRILMKADYEAWWNFDDMNEKYIEEIYFDGVEEYEQDVIRMIDDYRARFKHEEVRDGIYYVFWNEGEFEYCEGCDEDLQIYYSIILSVPLTSKVK